MVKVVVLMSTWNGMKFLPEQISSLFGQEFDGELSILVRDDGSTDDTVSYLRTLGRNVCVIAGENIGPCASFFELIRLSRERDADYFALCDQDDVWYPSKIASAISQLDLQRPALFSSAVHLVGESLEPIGSFAHPGDRSFVATLLCNYATGCTCVFNRAFAENMVFPPNSGKVLMHDWWLASIASINAFVSYDKEPSLAYRQHGGNHVGIKKGLAGLWAKVRRTVYRQSGVTRFDHARQLQAATHDKLDSGQRDALCAFLAGENSIFARCSFVARYKPSVGALRLLRFVLLG